MSASALQVLDNRNGKTTIFWERNKTGDGTVKHWNLYYSTRLQGPFSLLESRVQNTVSMGRNYCSYVVDRAAHGLRNDAPYFLNLTATAVSGAETPLDPQKIKIVYADKYLLSTRVVVEDVDNQFHTAADVDYITPDSFDGFLSYVNIARDTTNAIEVFISKIPTGVDPGSILFDEEQFIEHQENFTGTTYNYANSQPVEVDDTHQIRVRTGGVSGGFLTVTIGRSRGFKFSQAGSNV